MTQTASNGRVTGGSGAFDNIDSLAAATWLEDRLDKHLLKIVDTRYIVEQDEKGRFVEVPGTASYLESHIPGAVFLGLDDLRDANEPAHIVGSDVFEEIMSGLGIGTADEIVVYDTDGGMWAARLWWALRLYGHEKVRILDGGFKHWVDQGHPVETGDRIVAPGAFSAQPADGLLAVLDDVLDAQNDSASLIIDALTEPFHTGRVRLYAKLPAGHIPGAITMPAPDNLDPESHRLLPADVLRERWAPVVDGADTIITYCGGGMYGAFDLFVLHLLGYDAVLYDGAWEEWAANDHLPIATTPPGLADERL